MVIWLTVTVNARATSPLIVDKNLAQLFIDDFRIDSQHDLQRTLHEPTKDNGGNTPLLAIDREFENHPATLEANGTIVYDPVLKKYVMFAIGFSSAGGLPKAEHVRIYRFTSTDAMHWIKGDHGDAQHIAINLRDEASGTSATNTDLFSCFYDLKDSSYPYKGWAYFANWAAGREGIYYVRSHDGITWQRGQQILKAGARIIKQDGRMLQGPSDVTTFFHDELTGRFLAALKFSSPIAVGENNKLRSRAYCFLDRLDKPVDLQEINLTALIPAGADANGDLASDEYYASGGWRYQSVWLGELKIWHGHGDYPYSAAGSAFLKLIVSHDGLHWHKVPFANNAGQSEVFFPNGVEGGKTARNDGGYITLFSQGPLRIGNELIFYYGSSSYGKNHSRDIRMTGGGIFRARLRPDGFVSVDRGTLTTKSLAFRGDNLFVNSIGPIEVMLLNDQRCVLASQTIDGDSLAHRVMFKGKSLRDLVPGHIARLRFSIRRGGHLYSFSCQ